MVENKTKISTAVILMMVAIIMGCLGSEEVIIVVPVDDAATFKEVAAPTPADDDYMVGWECYMITEDDMRPSDGFVHGGVKGTTTSTWSPDIHTLSMHTSYPAYGNMQDDEQHRMTAVIKRYDTLRGAVDKIGSRWKQVNDGNYAEVTKLPYSDNAYIETQLDADAELYHVKAIFRSDQYIAEVMVFGYGDHDEGYEVADYYISVIASKFAADPPTWEPVT